MSFLEFTDKGFILFKQEALNHLAVKLSIYNDQENLVEKLKEAHEQKNTFKTEKNANDKRIWRFVGEK